MKRELESTEMITSGNEKRESPLRDNERDYKEKELKLKAKRADERVGEVVLAMKSKSGCEREGTVRLDVKSREREEGKRRHNEGERERERGETR